MHIKLCFPSRLYLGGHSQHIARGLRNEFLGCFPLQCPGVQLLIPLQHRHPRSLLWNALMTWLMASVMKATPVWPSSSSNLRLLNSLLQQPNCENELFSPPRDHCSFPAAPGGAPGGGPDGFSGRGPTPVAPPSIDKWRWGLLSRAWISAPSWSLPSAHWKETSRQRGEGNQGPEIKFIVKVCRVAGSPDVTNYYLHKRFLVVVI